MRLILTIGLLLTACGDAASSSPDRSPTMDDPIIARGRAIDGDTVSIDFRLSGADAFERRQLCRTNAGCWPCGKAAQDYAARMMKTGDATISITGKASYGRPIAVVRVDGRDLGEAMIAAGLAIPATEYLTSDPERATRYVAAYDRATSQHTGAHAGFYINPTQWRRGERLSCERRPKDDDGIEAAEPMR